MEALKPAFNALDAIISNIEAALNASPTKPDHNSSGQPHNAKQSKPSKKEKKQKKAPVPNVPVETAQFLQCDLRVAQVTSVTHHPEADGLFVLQLTYANDVKQDCVRGASSLPVRRRHAEPHGRHHLQSEAEKTSRHRQ
ncbi:hypothetical protein BWQ96_10722 [Gracilariopsis chorda]|uniref:tRNA-binding domain-containing protein n=1 Tax=Gracilariopsis chorda TaxID=448386 RepID=A0A2V3IBV9_9FLOR|nr:hypothetical protein BWQ96_10722 [Gracilariopsis chorda]|eukprot:PXF39584.1 hypothetical protein BWQ96_10722 [Gracilariopsis chorda]